MPGSIAPNPIQTATCDNDCRTQSLQGNHFEITLIGNTPKINLDSIQEATEGYGHLSASSINVPSMILKTDVAHLLQCAQEINEYGGAENTKAKFALFDFRSSGQVRLISENNTVFDI